MCTFIDISSFNYLLVTVLQLEWIATMIYKVNVINIMVAVITDMIIAVIV